MFVTASPLLLPANDLTLLLPASDVTSWPREGVVLLILIVVLFLVAAVLVNRRGGLPRDGTPPLDELPDAATPADAPRGLIAAPTAVDPAAAEPTAPREMAESRATDPVDRPTL